MNPASPGPPLAAPECREAAALRQPALDALRGWAILSVLVLHFTLAFGLAKSPLGDWLPPAVLRPLTLHGNFGVTLFFVLSGFLITHGLLQRHGQLSRMDVRAFYRRRAARIGPPLLLALAGVVLGAAAGLPYLGDDPGAPPMTAWRWGLALASVLSFWHNQLMQGWGYFHYVLNVYWSLSVEETFYLLLPMVALGLRRRRGLVALAVVLVVLGPVWRAQHASDEVAYLYAYPACFDAIAIGLLSALALQRWPGPVWRWRRVIALAAGLAMAALWWRGFFADPAVSFSGLAAATGLWIWAVARRPNEPQPAAGGWWGRVSAPLRWLGRHSYELYLFHILVLAAMRPHWPRASVLPAERLPLLAAYLAASALLAWGVARWVSGPARRAWA